MANLVGGEINVPQLNLKRIKPGSIILIIAKRGSGKSWICRSLLAYFKNVHKIPSAVVFNSTDEQNNFYSSFIPKSYIYDDFSSIALKKILKRQEKITDKAKKYYKMNKFVDPRTIIVMDDMMNSANIWKKDDGIKTIFFNGRHYFITYILILQDPMGITPDLRTNCDFVILLHDDHVNNQKKLYENYVGFLPHVKVFRKVFSAITKDYGCLVIDCKTNKQEEKLSWFRANDDKITSFGNDKYNKKHQKNYDSDWKRKKLYDRGGFDDLYRKNRDEPAIRINKI